MAINIKPSQNLTTTRIARAELANTLSHGLGLVLGLIALPALILVVGAKGDVKDLIGAIAFGVSTVLLYLTSTLYHAWPAGPIKRRLRVLDHSAIYLLIAGTYTPFTLGVLRGPWGWTLFGLIWAMAIAGIASKIIGGARFSKSSTALYLGMGWLIVIAIVPLWNNTPKIGMAWLLFGGLFYTTGVKFYNNHRDPFAHVIWHLFVVAGTACHFVAVILYSSKPLQH